EPGAGVVPDEEVVGRYVLQFLGATTGAGDQVAEQPALECRDIGGGETQSVELFEDAEKFGEVAWQFTREDQGWFALNRGALGDHPPDVVVDRSRSRRPVALTACPVDELVHRDALEHVPDM